MVIKNLAAVFPDIEEIERTRLAQETITEAAKFAMESGAVSCWPEDRWRDQIKTVTDLVESLTAMNLAIERVVRVDPRNTNGLTIASNSRGISGWIELG